jgi:hypothetical protein
MAPVRRRQRVSRAERLRLDNEQNRRFAAEFDPAVRPQPLLPPLPPANNHGGGPPLPPEDHGFGLEQLALLLAADVDKFEEQQQQQQQAQRRQDQQQQQDEDDGTENEGKTTAAMTMKTITGHCLRAAIPSSLPLVPTTMMDRRSGQNTMVEVLNTWRRCWLLTNTNSRSNKNNNQPAATTPQQSTDSGRDIAINWQQP